MTAVTKVVKENYANFNGRARRSEYWWFVLANAVVNIIASVLDNLIGITIFTYIVGLALLVPGIAVAVRRLHDIGKSGWLYLLAFTCVGIIPLIIWFAKDGDPQPNEYGPSPKYV